MTQDELKKAVAKAAIDYIAPRLERDSIIGVGTGSTANFFIDMLADLKNEFDGAVASSEATAERLKSHGIPVYDLNSAGELEFYVDGADETNERLELIKGGGGRTDSRKNRSRSCQDLYLHCRRIQKSRHTGRLPPTGRGAPHGTQSCGP